MKSSEAKDNAQWASPEKMLQRILVTKIATFKDIVKIGMQSCLGIHLPSHDGGRIVSNQTFSFFLLS